MTGIRILVADSNEAELYSPDRHGSALTTFRQFKHEESGLPGHLPASEKTGLSCDAFGGGGNGVDTKSHARDNEAMQSAREIPNSLEQGCRDRT